MRQGQRHSASQRDPPDLVVWLEQERATGIDKLERWSLIITTVYRQCYVL